MNKKDFSHSASKIIKREHIEYDPNESTLFEVIKKGVQKKEKDLLIQAAQAQQEALKKISPEEIERIRHEAYQEGFEKGHKEGLRSGHLLMEKRAENFSLMLNNIQKEYQNFAEHFAKAILELTCQVVEVVLKEQIKVDRQALLKLIDEAVQSMPESGSNFSLFLSSEDFVELEPFLIEMKEKRIQKGHWFFYSDPHLSIGSFHLKTEQSTVHFDMEERWQKIKSIIKEVGHQS